MTGDAGVAEPEVESGVLLRAVVHPASGRLAAALQQQRP